MSPIQPPDFVPDDVNVVHLGQNFYALKHDRKVRVTLASINALRNEFGITERTEFKKEGLRKKGTERVGSTKDLNRFPKIRQALVLKGLDPMDYVLIRFGPK